jgi:hypothetical protein
MSDEQPHIAQLFKRSPGGAPRESEADEGLPANDAPYSAFARRSNQQELSLHFITPAGTMRSFQYAHLDSDNSFTAECITLCFMGTKPRKVVILGRNLVKLYDYIHQHRTAWVRVAARPFAPDNEPIVTKVHIEPLKEDVGNEEKN